ncbi:hypothetical protein QFC21_004271 [Naganishia friedmannii]|uniref:Uncharacterized protein n=1 Tax=Naganishia friedmannii TaxID=89922 RepID=A0ACC2VI07_9TREE|nr:hypothetical protein QFC21_004271 [Naganishia friedmannii]
MLGFSQSAVAGAALLLARSAFAHPTPSRYNGTSQAQAEAQVEYWNGGCTVHPLGGAQDDGPALLIAFEKCRSNSIINLPGPLYTVEKVLNSTLFNTTINLDGIIQYTPNITYWSPNSIYLEYQNATTAWYLSGENVTLQGDGGIDGSGQVWWNAYATLKTQGGSGVAGGSSRIFARPIPLAVARGKHITVDGISITNSPFWHSIIFESSYVTFKNIYMKSLSSNESAQAANTDGWDTYRSDHIVIRDSVVINGDDCVSFKPNTTFTEVTNMYCDGSHGISVGSLGQYYGVSDIVSDIYIKNITMLNAEHGARIKVFPGHNDTSSVSGGGTGYVRNIDISDINFINFTGYASGAYKVGNHTVGSIRCSGECEDVTAKNIDLKWGPPGVNQTAGNYICTNVASLNQLDFTCQEVSYSQVDNGGSNLNGGKR